MSRKILVLSALVLVTLLSVLTANEPEKGGGAKEASVSADPKDWPMYNADVIGSRHNLGEKQLNKHNVSKLVEKWRFPPTFSLTFVGAIHATPVVVNGYVYFGTATLPDRVQAEPRRQAEMVVQPKARRSSSTGKCRPACPSSGFMNSPLVTDDTVYIADVGGMIYALDRATGKERWVVNTRSQALPGRTHLQLHLRGADPRGWQPHRRRRRLRAPRGDQPPSQMLHRARLRRRAGARHWQGRSGSTTLAPRPEPLNPPVKIKDDWGERTFPFRPVHQFGLVHAVV